MRLKIFLVAACLAVIFQSTSDARLLLQGEVSHADRLAPVEPNLCPGSTFDRSNLPTPTADKANYWYRIPTWMAGDWHKESQTDYYRYDYTTKQSDTTTRVVEAKSTGIWGLQEDDQGNIWHYDPTPFNTSVDAGDDTIVQLVRASEPLEANDQRFVRRSVSTQIRVDKVTSAIKAVESGEQITVYALETEGLLKRETSSKVFDPLGQPLLLGKSFSYETRTGPFKPRDTFLGKDVKKLFEEFMDKRAAKAAGDSM